MAIASTAMSTNSTFAPRAFSISSISAGRIARLIGARSAVPAASAFGAAAEPELSTTSSIAFCASRNPGRTAFKISPTDELPTHFTVPLIVSSSTKRGYGLASTSFVASDVTAGFVASVPAPAGAEGGATLCIHDKLSSVSKRPEFTSYLLAECARSVQQSRDTQSAAQRSVPRCPLRYRR